MAQTETILHRFQSSSSVDGANPSSGVFLGKRGTLYGTTLAGGRDNDGVVFQLSPPTSQGGPWNEEDLYGYSGGDRGGLAFRQPPHRYQRRQNIRNNHFRGELRLRIEVMPQPTGQRGKGLSFTVSPAVWMEANRDGE